MERLRAEIVVLKGLHGAQEELLLWNRERAETGVAPALLPARLCREAPLGAWCPLLPATFGVAALHTAESTRHSRIHRKHYPLPPRMKTLPPTNPETDQPRMYCNDRSHGCRP